MNLQIYKDYFGAQTGGGGGGEHKVFSSLQGGTDVFFRYKFPIPGAAPPPGDNKLYFPNTSVACPFFTLDELKDRQQM